MSVLQWIRLGKIPFTRVPWGDRGRMVYRVESKDIDDFPIFKPSVLPVDAINPSGLCMCGCGQKTPKYKHTVSRTGAVKGCSAKFIQGHNNLAFSHILYVVDEKTGCWNWNRAIAPDGYATHYKGKKPHRVFYENHKGKIPEGLEIDHLCRNRKCVNPDHLEAVTPRENTRRSACCKTTLKMAEEIRQKYATGKYTHKSLAKEYGVTGNHIGRITRMETWID